MRSDLLKGLMITGGVVAAVLMFSFVSAPTAPPRDGLPYNMDRAGFEMSSARV